MLHLWCYQTKSIMEDVGPLVVDRGNEKTFLLCLGVFPLSYSAGKKKGAFPLPTSFIPCFISTPLIK